MSKQWNKLWCNGILLSNKREQITDVHNNLDESQKHYTKWKKPDVIDAYSM